jgi:hypothetical protein
MSGARKMLLPMAAMLCVAASAMAAEVKQPSSDPRDFNGVYGRIGGYGPASATVVEGAGAGAAAAARGRGGGPPASALAAAGGTAVSSTRRNRMNCIPEAAIAGGNPYAEQIIQTPGRITFLGEFNHIVRRIYLDRPMPAHVTPSYNGYSVGHWEGDALVVETRGFRTFRPPGAAGMATLDRAIERITKSADGMQVNKVVSFEGRDQQGAPMRSELRVAYQWRGDQHLYEFICEEGAGDFDGVETR